jgi:hypothetical protein
MPYVLPCCHNICKECAIEYESQGKKINCYYDNCIVNGIYELNPNTDILAKIK